jgi:hypothetical protein
MTIFEKVLYTAVGAFCIFPLAVSIYAGPGASVEDDSVRPFHARVPEEQLVDLRRRLAATRWPERETVTDR